MNDVNEQPDDKTARAEVLLGRYFDRCLTLVESRELTDFWDLHPEFDQTVLKNLEIDQILHYFTRLEECPITVSVDPVTVTGKNIATLTAKDSPFAYKETLLFSELLDFEDLTRLAATSPALPKKTSASESDAARSEKPSKPYEPYKAPKWLPALCLLGIVAWLVWIWTTPDVPYGTFVNTQKTRNIVVVTSHDDVRWAEDVVPPRPGEPLSAGSLAFESGTVELLFFNGVRGIVEGPAEFTLLEKNAVFSSRGNWSVTVPPQGIGFEIQTRQITLRDLGTRFFAAVDREQCDVHVLDGIVEVELPAGEKMTLQADQGGRYRQNRLSVQSESIAGRFVTTADFKDRIKRLWYRDRPVFVPESPPLRDVVFQLSDQDRPIAADAVLHGGAAVPGRRPDSTAFRFVDRDDRIRLKSSGQVDSLTLVVELRLERLRDELNPIAMSEGAKRGGIVWNITPQGAVIFGVRPHHARESVLFQTPILFTRERMGRWCQLALALDRSQRILSVYLDGDPVYVQPVPSLPPLVLDRLDIGNWKPTTGQQGNIGGIDGAVGRFAVYPCALSASEIKARFFQSE